MKHVFSTSSEVLHVWAQQGQSDARCSNVNFNGRTCYSYGSHYPLGHFVTNKAGEVAVLINHSGYSVTTAKHIREACGAVSHHRQLRVRSTNLMRDLVNATYKARSDSTPDYDYIAGRISSEVLLVLRGLESRLMSNDAAKRKLVTLEKWKGEAALECETLSNMLAWFNPKAKLTRDARKALSALSLTPEAMKAGAAKARELEARKREKLRKAAAIANAAFIKEALPAWLAGIDHIQTETGLRATCNALREHYSHTLLRVVGEEVQTSQGARFPLAHGLKALPLIRAVVARGEVWKRNGHTIHLGHYQIDSIEHGAIVAGCHTIPISEVERLAASLGV